MYSNLAMCPFSNVCCMMRLYAQGHALDAYRMLDCEYAVARFQGMVVCASLAYPCHAYFSGLSFRIRISHFAAAIRGGGTSCLQVSAQVRIWQRPCHFQLRSAHTFVAAMADFLGRLCFYRWPLEVTSWVEAPWPVHLLARACCRAESVRLVIYLSQDCSTVRRDRPEAATVCTVFKICHRQIWRGRHPSLPASREPSQGARGFPVGGLRRDVRVPP